jgi:hypothetical protein
MARRAQAARTRETAEVGPPTSGRAAAILSLVEPPPAGARARQLFLEARAISLEHLSEASQAMAVLRDQLEAIVGAGELYAPGVRDFAERLSDDLFWRSKSFEALIQRQHAALQVRPQP